MVRVDWVCFTVELFVTGWLEKVATSFPVKSWRAFVSSLPEGSTYETVTVSPAKTVLARFKVTVDSEVETEETVIVSLLPAKRVRETVNCEVTAVVSRRLSLKPKVSKIPEEGTDAELNDGDETSKIAIGELTKT